MDWAKARLELFIEIIETEVIMNLRSDSFFEEFGRERKIGDGKRIIKVIGVSTATSQYNFIGCVLLYVIIYSTLFIFLLLLFQTVYRLPHC